MKRVLSLILAVLMCVSLLPAAAFADEEAVEAPAEPVEEVVEAAEETTPATEPELEAGPAALPAEEAEESAEADSFVESERAESVAEEAEPFVAALETEPFSVLSGVDSFLQDGDAEDEETDPLDAWAESDEYVEAAPGETVSFAVEVCGGTGEVSYQWYYYDGDGENEEIPGETGAIYEFFADRAGEYYCTVSDEDGCSCNVWFSLYIENDLEAWSRNGNTFYVKPGSTEMLEVLAYCNSGEIQYQWYDSDWNAIEGATAATYTVSNVTGYTRYICKVSDEYGSSRNVWFYVYLDNSLRATVSGSNNSSTELYVEMNGTAALEVSASCTQGDISYQWYDSNWNAIEGATDPSYTVSGITGYCHYHCRVQDEYDNSKDVWFYVYIDNDFRATVSGSSNSEATMPLCWKCRQVAETVRSHISGTIQAGTSLRARPVALTLSKT